jgi:SH3-like domain-containing protein
VRGGPDKDHEVSFIFTRVGWPVEITAEFDNWRRIRDSDGSEGWVYHSLLSGKRTAAVQLKDKTALAPLHTVPDAKSPVTAELQPGVLGTVKACTGTWCHLAGRDFDGWVEQVDLWGVYPNEKID